jgi:uncharacterized membrane protein
VCIAAPLAGWPAVVRLPAVVLPAIALIVAALRPWRWRDSTLQAVDRWEPSRRMVWIAALGAGLFLFWIVLTRFQSGHINAVDFTIYFDRPCFQTTLGRPLFVETTDDVRFAHRSEFADHAYWAMLPLCSLYAIYPTPLWLLGISVAAVVVGAVLVLWIMRRLGAGGLVASATALAFVLNDNTARTLNYGFHPEVLYAAFVPWMMHAGLRGARAPFVVATIACVLVKEDACMPIFAVSAALALTRFHALTARDRWLFLAFPTALALASLGVHYRITVPALTGSDRPTYSFFWANYGETPLLALAAMVVRPWRVLADMATSGFFRMVILPHLFLPFLGWRWALGVVPIVAVFSASANDQLRAFGIYYAIIFVPFLVIATSVGALALMGRLISEPRRARLAAASVVLAGALLVGGSSHSYSLRPWSSAVAAVPEALERLADEPVVLVQSGLYPHAGYDARVQLLTPETLREPRDRPAALLVAPGVNGYPFSAQDVVNLAALPRIGPMPGRMVAARLSGEEQPGEEIARNLEGVRYRRESGLPGQRQRPAAHAAVWRRGGGVDFRPGAARTGRADRRVEARAAGR